MTESADNYQKMISGQEYNCLDGEIAELRSRQQRLNRQVNQSLEAVIAPELLPHKSPSAIVSLPFYVSYGLHIHLAEQVFINSNVTLQDNAPIYIGKQTMIGPNVQFYTSDHPLDAGRRVQGMETAKEIRLGKRVWVGGGAVILPGITIGDEAVIGAGSVVTKDVAAKTVVAGNPAKLIKTVQ
ncbi:sugar O-acetyltransferase [Psychromonas aquimarina]|uniref:sugar O-acetyltransferase n=1 Tax=Psychromonas aquimarina TaxID=444919 RepID=UPI0003FD72C3|nr:sugar O-acetyltransferase [Psychromonas aquimarina]